MSIFERAVAAWKIQSEEERAAQAERERKQRAEFEKMLQEITGTADFTVRGTGDRLSAEIEGLVFIPEKNLYHRSRNISGLLIVTTGADGTQKVSGSIYTTGDLSRELERLKND